MQIEAGGKLWIVEQEQRSLWSVQNGVSGVSFRKASGPPDRVFVPWVLTPPRLTPTLARELFDAACVRQWRDPRDQREYRLVLESHVPSGGGGGRRARLGSLRFQREDLSVEAPWTLQRPLGLASDADLARLLDEALCAHTRAQLRDD